MGNDGVWDGGGCVLWRRWLAGRWCSGKIMLALCLFLLLLHINCLCLLLLLLLLLMLFVVVARAVCFV